MAKKKLTEEQRLKQAERKFDPCRCMLDAFSLIVDGAAKKVKRTDREMFDSDNEAKGGQVLEGRIISQNGRFVKVDVEREIIEVELA